MGLSWLKAVICEVCYQALTNFNSTVLQNAHDKRFCQKSKLTTIKKKNYAFTATIYLPIQQNKTSFQCLLCHEGPEGVKQRLGFVFNFFFLIDEKGFGSLGLGFGLKDIIGWEIGKSDWPWSDLTTHPRYPTSYKDYFLQSSVRGRLQRHAFSTGDHVELNTTEITVAHLVYRAGQSLPDGSLDLEVIF